MRAGYALSTMWRLVMVWMTRAWYNGGLSAEDERALDADYRSHVVALPCLTAGLPAPQTRTTG